jgi:hypothetical protein
VQSRKTVAKSLVIGAITAGCMAMTAVTVGATSTPRVPLARGAKATASSIPTWEVGPGWILATWNQNPPLGPGQKPPPGYRQNPPQDVFLVSPQGGRYLVVRQHNSALDLEGWSGDGKRALLVDAATSRFEQLDVATGATFDSFRLHTSNSIFFETASYTRPSGLAILVATQWNNGQFLQRYSLSGQLQLDYPRTFSHGGRFDGKYVSSPDGTQLVLGTFGGMALVGNDGTVLEQYRVPHTQFCTPTRWWAARVVLASCEGSSSGSRLYEIHVDTGAVATLTAVPRPPDLGDENAWAIRSGVYVQDAGGCGYQYLAKLQADHKTTPVTVPRVARGYSVFVLGANDNQLALLATVSCGEGRSVVWFDPAENTTTVVLGPPLIGGSVVNAISFPVPAG